MTASVYRSSLIIGFTTHPDLVGVVMGKTSAVAPSQSSAGSIEPVTRGFESFELVSTGTAIGFCVDGLNGGPSVFVCP